MREFFALQNKKKLSAYLVVIFILNIIIISLAQSAQAATYQRGSTGSGVEAIQTNLKKDGYYSGKIDGVYGRGTEEAVRLFQQKNDLKVDGKTGHQTQKAMGIFNESSSGAVGSLSGDLDLLARLISAESQGEPYNGQVAVAAVVLNRMGNPSFPNTMAGVIYQNGAFGSVVDGRFNEPVDPGCYKAAKDAQNGLDPSGGAIYYFDPDEVGDSWVWSRPMLVVIGRYRFCG